VLAKFSGHLAARGLVLPDPVQRDLLDYDAIRDACMAGDIPAGLDDVLYFVSVLTTRS
jgi:hypothetical protein